MFSLICFSFHEKKKQTNQKNFKTEHNKQKSISQILHFLWSNWVLLKKLHLTKLTEIFILPTKTRFG